MKWEGCNISPYRRVGDKNYTGYRYIFTLYSATSQRLNKFAHIYILPGIPAFIFWLVGLIKKREKTNIFSNVFSHKTMMWKLKQERKYSGCNVDPDHWNAYYRGDYYINLK